MSAISPHIERLSVGIGTDLSRHCLWPFPSSFFGLHRCSRRNKAQATTQPTPTKRAKVNWPRWQGCKDPVMQQTHTHTPLLSFIQMCHDMYACFFFPAFMLPSNLLGMELHPFSPLWNSFFSFLCVCVGRKKLKKEHEMRGGHLVAIAWWFILFLLYTILLCLHRVKLGGTRGSLQLGLHYIADDEISR